MLRGSPARLCDMDYREKRFFVGGFRVKQLFVVSLGAERFWYLAYVAPHSMASFMSSLAMSIEPMWLQPISATTLHGSYLNSFPRVSAGRFVDGMLLCESRLGLDALALLLGRDGVISNERPKVESKHVMWAYACARLVGVVVSDRLNNLLPELTSGRLHHLPMLRCPGSTTTRWVFPDHLITLRVISSGRVAQAVRLQTQSFAGRRARSVGHLRSR